MVVVTRLLGRTIKIRAAINFETGHVWVAFKSWRTRTDSLMANGSASSFTAAGQISRAAHRSALLVAAGMGVQTVIINLAFNLDTGNVRITFITIFASTNRMMFNNATEGMFSTSTRIFTNLIEA